MPVTAKLSRSFYDRLGDDLANELVEWFNQVDATYRGDLRQLNELNFSRFDASVGERFAVSEIKFAEFESRMEKRMTEFEARIEKRMTAFEARIEKRMTEFEVRIEKRLMEFETRMTEFEARVEKRQAEFEARIEKRLNEVELAMHHRFDVLQWRMLGLLAAQFALIAGLYLK